MARRRRRGTKSNRTRKGYVSAAARRRHGSRGGRYPVFDTKSARSALKLRGHSKKVSRSAVISKVSRYASRTKNASLKAAVRRARATDRRRKK